jgi:hypothetical protein
MAEEPSQDTTAEQAAAGAGEPGAADASVNQGATGNRPLGETPLSAQADTETDAYDERPEAFVGAAFAGGLALALILRRIAK